MFCVALVDVQFVAIDLCLLSLQDISYYCCIELSGTRQDISAVIAPFFDPKTGAVNILNHLLVATCQP